MREKALAVQFDLDADGELMRALDVGAAPTLIGFRAGEEKDRVVGFRDGVGLLLWLGSLERGKTDLHRGRGVGADLDQDMRGRLSFAKALLYDQNYIDATVHYAWLWNNMTHVNPDMSGVRVSYMAGEIKSLVGAHPPARRRFTEIRDASGAAAAADPGADGPRRDWIVLNQLLGDEDRTMSWFDGVKGNSNAARIIEHLSVFLVETLKSRGRWADLGRIYRNPVAELVRNHAIFNSSIPTMPERLGTEVLGRIRKIKATHFRTVAVTLFASLRAAGRTEEATAIQALRLDPSDEMRIALEQSPVRHN